jgi:hypothetical protein
MRAPASAFLVSGPDVRFLVASVEAISGVIASYPQGPSLRIVANPQAEESLYRVVASNNVSIASVVMRLEDAVLAFSRRRTFE